MDDTSFWEDEEGATHTALFNTLCGFCGKDQLVTEKDKLTVPDGWKCVEQSSGFLNTIRLACETCVTTEGL
jgi:hypothetical protein